MAGKRSDVDRRPLLGGLGSRLALLTLNGFNSIVIARYLEPHGRGEYFFFHAVLGLLTILADCSMGQSANGFASQAGKDAGRIHGILIRYVLVFWLATGLLVAAGL